MIIEIPKENSIIKWKNDEKDEWKVAEISDLIKAYERPQGEWLDYSEEYGYIECPFCGQATTCEGNIDELHYCWNCGAHLQKCGERGEEE